MERGPSTIFFSYPQNDSHSVGIHQQSSNKSNCAREFPVLAMDGNSISFTQFRAFASGGAIDDSTGVQIVSRCFQHFLDGANRHARIVTRSPPTRNRWNVSSRRTGCRTAIAIFWDSHSPVAIRDVCKVIAVVHTNWLKVICSLSTAGPRERQRLKRGSRRDRDRENNDDSWRTCD